MDEVILNDIPATPHVHYLEGDDWLFLLVMIVAIAALILLGVVLSKCLRRRGYFDYLKTFWEHRQNSVDSWLSKHSGFNRTAKKTVSVLSNIGIYLLLTVFALGAIAAVLSTFDGLFGIDKTYRRIVSKQHYVSRSDIYSALKFIEPEVILDTARVEEFVFCVDSIPNRELRSTVDSLYRVSDSDNTFIELYYLASMNGFPQDIQDFFFKQSLLKARHRYEVLNPLLQRYIVTDDLDGMITVDSLAKSWKWELGFYEERFYPQDYLRTKCLYYIVQYLERDFPVSDTVARELFDFSSEGYEVSCRLTDNYSYICLFFQDMRARYAYQINDPKADKYADQLIERSRRWNSLFSKDSFLFSPDRGGDIPGYYNRFFTDPLFIRYKSLLREKKYKKAALALEAMSSITEDIPFDADNPYMYVHDTLQARNTSDVEELLAYAKYDLASISENARIRRLMKNKNAEDWLTGAYLTGVNYLSPTESVFGSLTEYAFNGDLYFSDLIPYMSINYNNEDSRWVYNTALFLKGTGADISSLIERSVLQSDNDSLKVLLSSLKTERVFSADTYNDDSRFDALDSLLRQVLGHRIKDVLLDCFHSYLDVQNALTNDECAIEIVKVPSLDFSDDYYKAVILRNNMHYPIIVDLAPASIINDAISSGNLYGDGNHTLYSLVWKPIENYIHPQETIFIAPDGSLCSVNLSALLDTKNRRLMDRYNIHQCVSTKEIVKTKTSGDHSSIALFGGVIYDDLNSQNASPSQNVLLKADRGVDCDARGDGWLYLPWTKVEVESIDSTASCSGIRSSLYIGRDATEYQFKTLSGENISILHIATHGFYYSKSTASDLTFFERMAVKDNPLNRCGLIMTGGQRAWLGEDLPDDEEDGILLGSEIARMDLTNVDMVVLSACNTGLGDISYEGVSGLQRAFKQAGVNNIIMTLSIVDDNATRTLMHKFYEILFSGKDVRFAFSSAIDWMRNNTLYGEPQYWAPFVLLN